MKKKCILISWFLFLLGVSFVDAYELATKISKDNGKATVSSIGYAKLGLVELKTNSKGMIHVKGKASVSGAANIVMWVRVDDKYYFSKLPALQNIDNRKVVHFKIPFDAGDKTITEVILEIELLKGGKVEISDIKLITN